MSIAGMGAQAADMITGPEDTEVELTLQRQNQQITITIVRAIVKMSMVTDEILSNNDYYIALMSFGFGASSDMRNAIERYLTSGAEKLIIDMRHNPGGSVSELEAIVDMFLPPDTDAFSMRGAGYHYTYTTSSSPVSLPSSSEIVLLVDEGSASAAEMLALILQDHEKAIVVGETTFGKGTAQSLVDYVDGSSFKYTIYERFSTQTNTSINHEGVTPDHVIILDEERLEDGYDNQLEYAKAL
jgi:carboxyl-terminal processing protease